MALKVLIGVKMAFQGQSRSLEMTWFKIEHIASPTPPLPSPPLPSPCLPSPSLPLEVGALEVGPLESS